MKKMYCATGVVAAIVYSLTSFAVSNSPTSGDIVLIPGQGLRPLTANEDGAEEGGPGWNIPGRFFKSGDGWWALECDRNCALVPQRLRVNIGTHPDYDGPPLPSQLLTWHFDDKALVGKTEPHVDAGSKTLAFFKPLRSRSGLSLKPGAVTTWWHAGMPPSGRPSDDDRMGSTISMGASGNARLLPKLVLPKKQSSPADDRHHAGTSVPGESASTVVLELQIGDKRQKLGAYQWDIEGAHPLDTNHYLLWAGDLDGDGRLDLLVTFSGRGWNTVLYLSSAARPDELVGEAGRFIFWPPNDPGC